ncbi:Uncharacterised protein [uncultured Flavonifractor sp.]|nr:Uncharacterised protein [uncultured Flavonifractor sp.]
MANLKLRRAAAGAGVKLWQVAEALGVADATLSRWLRRELPEEKAERIMAAIRELSVGENNKEENR